MNRDVLVNALYDPTQESLTLYGRSGAFEIDWPDQFYVAQSDVERLPSSWADGVGMPDRGFVPVRWPERVRRGGSRTGRLRYYNDTVFLPLGITPLEADVDPAQRFLIENPKVQLERNWKWLWYDLETEMVKD